MNDPVIIIGSIISLLGAIVIVYLDLKSLDEDK